MDRLLNHHKGLQFLQTFCIRAEKYCEAFLALLSPLAGFTFYMQTDVWHSWVEQCCLISTGNISALIPMNEVRQDFICPVINRVLTGTSTLTTQGMLCLSLNQCNHLFEALKLSIFSHSVVSIGFACNTSLSVDILSALTCWKHFTKVLSKSSFTLVFFFTGFHTCFLSPVFCLSPT